MQQLLKQRVYYREQ